MKRKEYSLVTCLGLLFAMLFINAVTARSDQAKDDPIDILHYKIEAEAIPETHVLRANAAVTFRTTKATQSAVFEMNGSLKITKVTTEDGRDLQFVQDTLEGLNVKVDLGNQVPVNQDITLKFQYEGQLISPQGGVLANKRLAYIGQEGSYLTYSSRWFPFHGYAADNATYEISFITPADLSVVGLSTEPIQTKPYVPNAEKPSIKSPEKDATEEPVKPNKPARPKPRRNTKKTTMPPMSFMPVSYTPANTPASPVQQDLPTAPSGPRNIHTFVSKTPVLPGTFAFGRYSQRPIKSGGVEIEFFIKPGSEALAGKYGEELSLAVNYYVSKFGAYPFGTRFVVAEIDNESLDSTSGPGIMLLAEKFFKERTDVPSEFIYREAAYQWWGQSVLLKSFDDTWLSHGLAQYSALTMQENNASTTAFRDIAKGAMERALAFESQTSIARAPVELDDQSEAFRSIVFYKGAFVYRMLRLIIGDGPFDTALKTYFEKYQGKQASIDDFEAVVSKAAGKDMRYFFGQWVDSTGVPEFQTDYQMIRTKDGGFKVRGTLKQENESFNMPVEVELLYEGGSERTQLNLQGKTADFVFSAKGKPLDIVVDPDSKLLKISDGIRVSVIVRRGIEHFRNEEYPEAEQQFLAAIKLNRGSSWAWYNLGLLYFAQKNFQKANDTFSEALELDLQPRWVEVWSYIKRGNCYDALGQRERAVAEYNKAISLGDNYEKAQEVAQQFLSAPYRRNQSDQNSKVD